MNSMIENAVLPELDADVMPAEFWDDLTEMELEDRISKGGAPGGNTGGGC